MSEGGYIRVELSIRPQDVIAALREGGIEKPTLKQVQDAIARLKTTARDAANSELVNLVRITQESRDNQCL